LFELETLSAPELRRLIDRGVKTAIVPFGSVEDHGAHLPLGADALLGDAVGREVASRLDAILLPTVRIGYAEQHGVVSVESGTLAELASDIARSLAGRGLRVIALVSTHGGNARPLQAAAERVNTSLDGALVCTPSGDVGPSPGSYSGEWLTSVMLALHPELVDVEQADDQLSAELAEASQERGEAHLRRFVDSVVAGVRAVAR
jgi:creatinine amidohydrolase